MTTAQRRASSAHRRRTAAQGLVRVEILASAADAGLIRALAETLRGDADTAATARSSLRNALGVAPAKAAIDMFASDLPDDVFDGVFTTDRDLTWRETDL